MLKTTHTHEALFRMMVSNWINISKIHVAGSKNKIPGYLQIVIDENWVVTRAHINAPLGQRLAEELLDLHHKKVDLNDLAIIRSVYVMGVYVRVDADGTTTLVSHDMTGTSNVEKVRKYIYQHGIRWLPITSVMTGD